MPIVESIARGSLGLLVLLLITFLLSENKKQINWRLVGAGLVLQFAFAVLILKVPYANTFFEWLSDKFVDFLDFSKKGSEFLFGGLVTDTKSFGFIFAFQILPTVVFFSAITSALYFLGVLQLVVKGIAWLMSKTMKLSGAESLSTAGNIFLGQTEAPLLIKPFLETMTRSEILCVMVGGMANIAGGVLAAYVQFLGGSDPEQQRMFAMHLMSASIMSAPATIVVSKILLPETQTVDESLVMTKDKGASNLLEAITNGTTDGIKLAVNVGAMLIVFVAIIFMMNALMMKLGDVTNLNALIASNFGGRYDGFSMQFVMGMIFAPLAWLMGVPSQDMLSVGQLLGEKTILNEFVAFKSLGDMKVAAILQQKSTIIATYALCGFANFASIGIQIGGIGALAPNQKRTLSELGIKALIGGSVASFYSACMAGILVG